MTRDDRRLMRLVRDLLDDESGYLCELSLVTSAEQRRALSVCVVSTHRRVRRLIEALYHGSRGAGGEAGTVAPA